MSEVGRLIRSHVVTDHERKAILHAIAQGTLTKKRASDQIEGLLAAVRDRKAAERAAGKAQAC